MNKVKNFFIVIFVIAFFVLFKSEIKVEAKVYNYWEGLKFQHEVQRGEQLYGRMIYNNY